MRDYSMWLARAEQFVRAAAHLPGEWSVDISVKPPLDAAACDQLAESLPLGLPTALRDLYATASAEARICYWWSPPKRELAAIGKIFPHQRSFYGGPKFCAAVDLKDLHEDIAGFAEIFEEQGGHATAAIDVVRSAVPFIAVGNGDYVALHVTEGSPDFGVFYVSHDTDPRECSPLISISGSIEQFLNDWERVGYIGPEAWLLQSFMTDPPSDKLDVDGPMARRWRMLLRGYGLPIAD
jgi:hypothetical protein